MTPRRQADETQATSATRNVVFIYAVFAAIWILASDSVVGWMFSDPAQIVFASTAKGWLFVAVTSLLLYRLIRRLLDQLLAVSQRELEAETKKAEALQLLGTIAENSSDAIFAKDLDGRYLLANREVARVVGKSAAEVLGHDDTALFPKSQSEMIRSNDRQVIADNRIITYDETLSVGDERRTYLATKGPLRNAEGQVTGVFGISRDITDRKRAADALRASEERLRVVIERFTAGIAFSRDGIVLETNPAYLKMFGYEHAGEISGRPLIEHIAPQCRAKIRDRIERRAQGLDVETTYESVGLRKDGSQFPFLVSTSRIEFPDGPMTIAFLVDITERKRQDDLLKDHNRLLASQKAELEAALGRVKRLEGMLSICLKCKKIRAENNVWQKLELYITQHSDAVFTHGLCPDCLAEQLK